MNKIILKDLEVNEIQENEFQENTINKLNEILIEKEVKINQIYLEFSEIQIQIESIKSNLS